MVKSARENEKIGRKVAEFILTNYILTQDSCKKLPDLMFGQKIYSKYLCLIKNCHLSPFQISHNKTAKTFVDTVNTVPMNKNLTAYVIYIKTFTAEK